MRKSSENRKAGKLHWVKKAVCCLLALVCCAGVLLQSMVLADAKVSAKSLCKAALDVTGGSDQLKSQTTKASDCPIFTIAQSQKISSIAYLCDDKEIYSICVAKVSKKSDVSDIYNSIKTYKNNNSNSNYLSDYSATEQKVFKNAVYGKKGKYVWYIAMSSKKDVNKKGQDALKKQL